jgi:competence protein ComEC
MIIGAPEPEMYASYDPALRRRGFRSVPGVVIAVWVTAVLCAALTGSVGMAMIQIAASALMLMAWQDHDPVEDRSLIPMTVALIIAVALAGVTLWRVNTGAEPPEFGLHQGWTQVVSEPRPQIRGVRVVLKINGERFEAFPTDPELVAQISNWQGGQQVYVLGEIRPLSTQRAQRVAWQHVRGSYRIDAIRDLSEGSRLSVISNRFRASISRGAQVLPPNDAALFQGLVIGDRSGQTPEMQQRYAASGLSHLTVVSGLNVSLLLVAAAPLLTRARPVVRWVLTLALLAWFVSLTRYEPSILRAATMAALVATATLRGDDRGAWRVLWVAVGLLVLHDPALVGSVGLWLSVGATAGVAVLGPRLSVGLARLGLFARPLGISLGAQIGVAPPMLLLMDGIPLWSVPANLVAVPVASVIKLYGLPAAAVAGAVPQLAELLMFPTRVGVRWVDLVARAASTVEVAPWISVFMWVVWVALSVGAMLIWASSIWATGPQPDKNRDRHDSAPTQRR